MFRSVIFRSLIIFLLISCAGERYALQNFDYPEPVDTASKKISIPVRKQYDLNGIYLDNRFDGSRLNDAKRLNDSTIVVTIAPENTPVNNSPWYAFKIWSDSLQKIYVQLHYQNGSHRYSPKKSADRKNWQAIATADVKVSPDKKTATFPLRLGKQALWIAAQPVLNSTDVAAWLNGLKNNPLTYGFASAGKSVQQKEIPFFKIGQPGGKKKKVILLFSRQHPPEITGFLALQSFVDELIRKDSLSARFYRQYEFWVFPLINPDGVDLGHWRHNAHGVDLNRDWAYFNQPETRAVRDFAVNEANKTRQQVVLGIDFHSTFKDLYYVNEASKYPVTQYFPSAWTNSIDRLTGFKTYYDPSPIKKPVSKAWFYYQFGASGITYEVGDQTPVHLIDQKARAAAVSLMNLLWQAE